MITTNITPTRAERIRRIAAVACVATASVVAASAVLSHADPFRSHSIARGVDHVVSSGDSEHEWPVIPATCELDDPCDVSVVAGTGSVRIHDEHYGDTSVPYYGFGVDGSDPVLPGEPGSIIKVPLGTTIHLEVVNELPGGQQLELSFPSLTSVTATDSGYDVVADRLGTMVFQPGTNPEAPRQVAMGLVGILIVTPIGPADAIAPDTTAPDTTVAPSTSLAPTGVADTTVVGASVVDTTVAGALVVDTTVAGASVVDTTVVDTTTTSPASTTSSTSVPVTPASEPESPDMDCVRCAYDGNVAYADEVVVATVDLDPEFAVDPFHFDMSYFGAAHDAQGESRQVYHLINGRAFPDTDLIDVRAGDSLLIRYVNAGVDDKNMGVLGLHQVLLARNGSAYVDPQSLIAPLIGPGETADVVIDIPVTAEGGQKYSLRDQSREMNGATAAGFGGALTFIDVWVEEPSDDEPDDTMVEPISTDSVLIETTDAPLTTDSVPPDTTVAPPATDSVPPDTTAPAI